MNKIALRFPKPTFNKLEASIKEGVDFNESEIEVILEIDDRNLNVREFAAYLELADRVYGRTFRTGLISYSLQPRAQLRISETRKGSLIVSFADSYISQLLNDPSSLILLFLFLKYGPAGIKSLSETAKNLLDSYKSYEEGRLARVNRKKVIEEMRNDEFLRLLEERERGELRRMMNYLEKSEKHLLPAARRFTVKFIRSISIRLRRKNSNRP